MASVYSKQLARGVTAAGGSGGIYTAPTGLTVVVRTIALTAQAAGSSFGLVYQDGSTGLFGASLAFQYDTMIADGRWVIPGGQAINFAAFTAAISYHISGYVLD